MKLFPGVICLLFCAVFANGQTYFWNRNPAFSGSGGIAKSYNWTSARNGTGQHPVSVDDDGFSTLDTLVTWKFLDKDGVDSTGTAFLNNGRVILRGSGADFGGVGPEGPKEFFTGIGRSDITGNFDVSVKVDSQVASHPWSKAGILIANSLGKLDSGGLALVAVTPSNGAIFEAGLNAPIGHIDYTDFPGPPVLPFPVWLRLVKSGTSVFAFYRTDSTAAWIPIGTGKTPLGIAADSDIGLFVVAVDSIGKTSQPTAAAFDNFLGGGDIADPELNLSFDGLGSNSDVDVGMAGNFAARSLDFTGYTGKMSFNSHTLSVTGKVRFVPGMTLARGTGTLAFVGNTGPDTLWVKPNDTLPNIRKTGAASLALMGGTLFSQSLRIEKGSFDFNGFDIALKGHLDVLNGTPATLPGLGGRTLTVEGNATFAGLSASAPLGLNPAAPWIIKVTGALTADSADIGKSDARGFSKGKAGKGSKDSQGNFNWEFWAPSLPPAIVRHPLDVVAKPGWKVGFSMAAQGTAPFTYEWRQHGDTTVLSRDTLLVLDSVKPSQTGTLYYCVASNDLGKDTTRKAELTVRNCDSAFAAPANLAVTEGNKVVLTGKTGCATEVVWTPISGPVPRLLDPGVDTLIFTAPRIKGDTILVLEFSARFGASQVAKRVTVKVKDSIPDPVITLETAKAWTGMAPKVIKPKIGNGAELAKFPTYPVRYLWSVSPLLSDSTLGGDSLVLADPFEDGDMDVFLCVDNGGIPSCVRTVVEIKRLSVSIRNGALGTGPFSLSGNRLAWNESGHARVQDWSGRVLWEVWGSPGYSRELPARAERSLRIGTARLEFVSVKQVRR